MQVEHQLVLPANHAAHRLEATPRVVLDLVAVVLHEHRFLRVFRTAQLREQALAFQNRRNVQPGQVEQRGQHVDVTDQRVVNRPTLDAARRRDDERDMRNLLVHRRAFARELVCAHKLAVIGREDDPRVVGRVSAHRVDHPPDFGIHEAVAAEVQRLARHAGLPHALRHVRSRRPFPLMRRFPLQRIERRRPKWILVLCKPLHIFRRTGKWMMRFIVGDDQDEGFCDR